MVHINGNTITIALGIFAAIIVISGIIILQIKSFRYYCQHREEEMRLNAETDSTPIQLPARGFSLLREWASHGNVGSHSSQQPDGALSRGASLVRTLSQMGRWRSPRVAPTTDLESQVTEYRSVTIANFQAQTRDSDSIAGPARAESSLYQSRGQQWGSQASLPSTRTSSITPADGYHPVAPRASEDITDSLDAEVQGRGGIAPGRYLPWEESLAPMPPSMSPSVGRYEL